MLTKICTLFYIFVHFMLIVGGQNKTKNLFLWRNDEFHCIKPICCSWYMPNLIADVWHYAVRPFGPNQKAKRGSRGLQKAQKTAKISFFTFLTSPVGLIWPHTTSIDCVFIKGVWHNHLPPFGPNQKAERSPRGPQRAPKEPKSAFFNLSDDPVGLNMQNKTSIGCAFI